MKKVSLFKKVAIAVVALTASVSAIAQERGDMAVGANVIGGIYADKLYSIGVGAKFLYNVIAPLRLAGEVDFSVGAKEGNTLATSTSYTFQDFSVYAHYLFAINDRTVLYPLAGVGMLRGKTDVKIAGVNLSSTDSRIAYAVGGGFDQALTDNLAVNAELRLKLHGGNHIIYLVGIAYKF